MKSANSHHLFAKPNPLPGKNYISKRKIHSLLSSLIYQPSLRTSAPSHPFFSRPTHKPLGTPGRPKMKKDHGSLKDRRERHNAQSIALPGRSPLSAIGRATKCRLLRRDHRVHCRQAHARARAKRITENRKGAARESPLKVPPSQLGFYNGRIDQKDHRTRCRPPTGVSSESTFVSVRRDK